MRGLNKSRLVLAGVFLLVAFIVSQEREDRRRAQEASRQHREEAARVRRESTRRHRQQVEGQVAMQPTQLEVPKPRRRVARRPENVRRPQRPLRGKPARPGQLQIHELLASNRGGRFDEHGRREDWLELRNQSTGAVSLKGCFLSDDPAEPTKWALPDVALAPASYHLLWCSGRGRHAPSADGLAHVEEGFQTALIDHEHPWLYRLPGRGETQLPEGWNRELEAPAGFRPGYAGFGYGDGDDRTDIPRGTRVVLVRATFEVADPGAIETLVLGIDYDDGFVAYLNGERVADGNAPFGPVNFRTSAGGNHEAGAEEYFDLSAYRKLLRAGTNVFAVAGLNVGSSSTDFSLRPRLGSLGALEHAPFRLPRRGGTLVLTGPDGSVLDQVEYPEQRPGISYGRAETSSEWGFFAAPTPEARNGGEPLAEPPGDFFVFEPPPGRYEEAVRVRLEQEDSELLVRYTSDGSLPTAASSAWHQGLRIVKPRVLRVAGFLSGEGGTLERATPVRTVSYLIAPSRGLPVLSFALDPRDYRDVHLAVHAHGRHSERAAHFELFTEDGGLAVATGFGLRLHGGYGRNGGMGTKKSYRAYFRKSYGVGRLDYPVIPDTDQGTFDKLVLRANFNDRLRPDRGGYNAAAVYVRDEVMRALHRDMGAIASRGAWYVLYVNGEYKGLYNVVERLDEDLLQAARGEDTWDILKTGGEVAAGSSEHWRSLCQYADRYDLSDPQHYRVVSEKLDLKAFTAYVILNLWAQNEDWPHNNWCAARPQRPDGKWFFLSWDAEYSLGLRPRGYQADSIAYMMSAHGRDGPGGTYLRRLFRALMASDEYRAYFAEEGLRYLEGPLAPERVLAHIRREAERISGAIGEECARFAPMYNGETWSRSLRSLEEFARHRGQFFRTLLSRPPFVERVAAPRSGGRSF